MLKQVSYSARKLEASQEALAGAIRVAHESGASLREIAAAAGLGHMTVKRIIDREG